MRKVLYTKFSRERRNEFQIMTRITEEDGIRRVWKLPLQKEGELHIRHMYENYRKLEHLYAYAGVQICPCELDEEKCAQIFTEVFRGYVPEGKSPMCGNTIGQDRRFMARWIPGMERYFHYRSIDVSTIKELCRRWAPEKVWVGTCVNKHQALADIAESIHELSWYRREVFRI